MTLTKNSENYLLQDSFEGVNVNGTVEKNTNGGINISINTDEGSHAFYSKDRNNHVNYNFSFDGNKSIINYMQGLVESVERELANEVE